MERMTWPEKIEARGTFKITYIDQKALYRLMRAAGWRALDAWNYVKAMTP